MNKKITIRDVAQAAGVSISTVHQALNDKPGVSEVTREHIRMIWVTGPIKWLPA